MSHGKLRVLYANGTWHKDNTMDKGRATRESDGKGAVKERKRDVKPFANAGPVYDRAWSSLGRSLRKQTVPE